MITETKNCRGCGESLASASLVVNLGSQYVVDFVKEADENLLQAPLVVVRCSKCDLVQLKHKVEQDRLFTKFWYRSGINESMRDALLAVVMRASEAVELEEGDKVLDIGCNDGTLLGCYAPKYKTVGIDPCKDLVLNGQKEHRIDVPIVGFFSKDAVKDFAPFKIITAVAMFYDLDNPLQFLEDCREVLDPNGVLVIQMNYLRTMIANCAFDNISHEHLTYYCLHTLLSLVEKAGLEIVVVQTNDVNGGS